MPSSYDLSVVLEDEQVKKLASKKLYISRKVNERYTVIWSSSKIEAINKFSWNDNFEMFAMDRFTPGEKVLPTGTKEIWKGHILTFNKDGSTTITKDEDAKVQDRIQIRKNPVPIWPGLSGAFYIGEKAPPTSGTPKEEEPSKPSVPSKPTLPEKMTGIPLNLSPPQKPDAEKADAKDAGDTKDAKVDQKTEQPDDISTTVTDLTAQVAATSLSSSVTPDVPANASTSAPETKDKPAIDEANTKDKPAADDANTKDKPTADDSNAKDKPVAEESNTKEQPTTDDANSKEKPVTDDSNTKDKPATDDANTKDKPATDDTNAKDKPATEESNAKGKPAAGTVEATATIGGGTASVKLDGSKSEVDVKFDAPGIKIGGNIKLPTDPLGAAAAAAAAAAGAGKTPPPVAGAPATTTSDTTAAKVDTTKKDAPVTLPPPPATPFFLGRYGTIAGANSTLVPSSKVMVWMADAAVDKVGETFIEAFYVAEIDISEGSASLVYEDGAWSKGDLKRKVALKTLDWKDGKFVPGTPLPKKLIATPKPETASSSQ